VWQRPKTQDKENSNTIQEGSIAMEVIDIQKHVEPIYKITGTETSCAHTLTEFNNKGNVWANVRTAKDERCSGVLLLEALQGQEKASRAWDKATHQGLNHTICYLIQRERRCFNFMPFHMEEPLATTNICHLVEMIALLGLVRKEFDIEESKLRAEGNGYMIKSEFIRGLGILARFSRVSRPVHEENRIIPCIEIKRLCFGEIPSIFDKVMGQNDPLQVGPGRLENCLKSLLPRLGDEQRQLFLKTTDTSTPLVLPSMFSIQDSELS
jgi:hypothetical protein